MKPAELRPRTRPPLAAYVVVFVSLALAWSLIVPPYEALDELEHTEVVRYIATTGRLPAHGEAEADGYRVRQEASQPPLYHLLTAAWVRLLALPLEPNNPDAVPESMVKCGLSGAPYGRAVWSRSPLSEPLLAGSALTVRAERLWSTVLQTFTLAGAWALARRAFPKGPVPLLVLGLVAFNPQFLLVAAGVNNDNAIVPLATWGLVLAVDLETRGPTPRRLLTLGCVAGLAAVSKLSGLGLVGLGGLVLLVRAIRTRTPLGRLVLQGLMLVLPAGLIPLPWALRNLRLYGDPTALQPMLELVGRRAAPSDLREVLLVLRSYWGQLPCAFYPAPLYWPIYVVMGVGLAALLLRWRELTSAARLLCAISAAWTLVIVAAYIRWNSVTPATGGRLLFPAAPAIALLIAAGWSTLSTRMLRPIAALVPIWSLVMLISGPMALFSPPRLVPLNTEVLHQTAFAFGSELALRGYEAEISNPVFMDEQVLDLTLYWQALVNPSQDWAMAIQLVSAEPGGTSLRLNYNGWPGRGNLPTSAWPTGRLIRDRYRLPISATDSATQAWALDVLFYDINTGERLPVSWESAPADSRARLTSLRVAGAPVDGAVASLEPPVVYGADGAILLQHAAVERAASGSWKVSLIWSCKTTPGADYTVFVHAHSDDESFVTADGPPAEGRFPTSLWKPGDLVIDNHVLAADPASPPTRISVGLYNPATLERVPARRGDITLSDGAFSVWESLP